MFLCQYLIILSLGCNNNAITNYTDRIVTFSLKSPINTKRRRNIYVEEESEDYF